MIYKIVEYNVCSSALGTTLQGEGAAGYISAALFYFAIGFRQYTGMFLHTLIIYIRAVS